MTVVVSRPTEEPILIAKVTSPHMPEDLDVVYKESQLLARNLTGDLYFIIDVSEAKINFYDSLITMAEGAKILKEEEAPDSSTKTTLVFVGSGGILALATKAMGQDQYGNIRVPLFETIEEALQYSRERLAYAVAE